MGASILGMAADTAVAVQGTAAGDRHIGDTDLDIAEGTELDIVEGTALVPAVDIVGDRAVGLVADTVAVVVLADLDFADSIGREADISGIAEVEPSTS